MDDPFRRGGATRADESLSQFRTFCKGAHGAKALKSRRARYESQSLSQAFMVNTA